jgi:hypothetical protein
LSGAFAFVVIFFSIAGAVGAVAYFTYRAKLRRAKAIERGLKMVPIMIHLPPPSSDTAGENRDVREVMREKTSQAEVLYNMIAGTATGGFKSSFYGQRHIAFELIAVDGVVHYFAAVPVALVSVVTKAIQTAYPGARLEEVEDHNIFNQEGRLAATLGGEMVLRAESAYPIATYEQLERDPMEALLTTMTGLEKLDGVAVQLMVRPAHSGWTKRSEQIANLRRKTGHEGIKFSAMDVAKAALKAPQQRRDEYREVVGQLNAHQPSKLDETTAERIEEKTKHPGFEVLVRVIVSTSSVQRSQKLLQDIATAFALFEAPGLNGFKFLPALDVQGLVTAFIFRFFPPEIRSNILNSEELATLFHFPDSQFTPSSSVERQQSKQVDGPVQLPSSGLLFGHNEFRGVSKEIHLSPEDRRRHTYILGQTGTGKSTLLENLAVQDMKAGNGFAFIDPHGDSAERLLAMVPKERAEDIVYFNPADTEYPLGLNLFEFTDPQQKDFLVQETINMLYKLYDPGKTGIIGPRYEHWYRNAALTLMADPGGATFIEIPKVFTDTDYLKQKFKYLRDPTVIDFWTKEMGQTSDYHKSEMLGWFVSKFGAFQNNEMMRNIIGQTKSAFNMRDIMDNKKLLIVNLSKGRVGELNSQLLGMIFVIKFQAAAMSRADLPEAERKDFCLYVDEFQNFSTDSFASILSEARKYRLNLIVANQFIGQLPDQVREAVFGNIGTIVAHRMGPDDAEFMVKQFQPVFDTHDLVNIPNFNAAMRLMIGGLPSQPFTLRDLAPLGAPNLELGAAVKELSAAKFGIPKAEVEAEILRRFSGRAAAPAPNATAPATTEPAVATAPAAAPVTAPVATHAAAQAVAAAPVAPPAPVSSPAPAQPVAEVGQVLSESGFADLGAPVNAAAVVGTPPPIGAPPVDLPQTAAAPAVAASVPAAAVPAGGMALPPIGAPPVQLPAAPMAVAPAVQQQSAQAQQSPPPVASGPVGRPLGVADRSTLTVSDITGGRAPAPKVLDLSSIPVMAPGAEPPVAAAQAPAPGPAVMQSSEPFEPEPAPLGSGVALEGDPYANIEVLGDLTPPAAGGAVQGDTGGQLAAAGGGAPPAGEPLPNDPYAGIDVMATGGAGEPVTPGGQSTAPAPAPAPEPAPEPAPVPEPTPPAPMPAVVAVQEQVAQPAPAPQPSPPPPSLLAPMPPGQPAPESVPVPDGLQRAADALPMPHGVAEPSGAAQSENAAAGTNEPLIHFVDPSAEQVMQKAEVPEPVLGDEGDIEAGLPEGVHIFKAGDTAAPAAPVAAPQQVAAPPVPPPAPVAAPPPPPAPVPQQPPAPPPVPVVAPVAPPQPAPPPPAPPVAATAGQKPSEPPIVPATNEKLVKALEAPSDVAAPAGAEKLQAVAETLAKPGDQVKPVAPAPPSGAVQIEKAEHEIDDLLSASLIRSDDTPEHRRLPEPVAPPRPEGDVNVDLNAPGDRPAPAQTAASEYDAEHHGLKVIQPLEPIVPAKERFAKELAEMNKSPQAQAAAPPKPKFKLPFAKKPQGAEATPQPVPAVAPPPAGAVAPPPPPAAPPPEPELKLPPKPQAAAVIVKHAGSMLPEPPPAPVEGVVQEDDVLPKAESLAADDVAKARAEKAAAEAMQKSQAPADAPVVTHASKPAPKPEPKKKAEKPSAAAPEPSKPKKGAQGQEQAKSAEHVGSTEEEEHNRPSDTAKEHGALTGKLILPTGEKPKPEPVQPKVEKPKKLAPGEVFVDASGNVTIGE